MSNQINAINSADQFIQLFDKDSDVSLNKAPIQGIKIACYIFAPFYNIPLSLHSFGNRIVSMVRPNMPQEKGAVFLTPEKLQNFDFQKDDTLSAKLRENFSAIFACLMKHPNAKRISILYNPEKYNVLNMCSAATSYANGQIVFNSSLENLSAIEAEWVLGHELGHYDHNDGWVSDIYNMCGAAASVALYFNHSFLAFYISQMAFVKGLTLLGHYFEYRADEDGTKLLNNNRGAVSYFTRSMIGESLVCLDRNSKFKEIYRALPQSEQLKILRHLAENHRAGFDPMHPSPWDRCKRAEQT
jgi:Zn-dependent protease with chaperone function